MTYDGFIMSVGTALVVIGSRDGNWPTIIFGMALLIWGAIFIAIEERRMNGKIKELEERGKNLEDKVSELEREMDMMKMSAVPMKVSPEPPTVVNPVLKIDTTGGMPDMNTYRDWITTSNLRSDEVK